MDDRTNIPNKEREEDKKVIDISDNEENNMSNQNGDKDSSEPDPMMESLKKLLSKSTLYSKILQKKMSEPTPPPPPKPEPEPEQQQQQQQQQQQPAAPKSKAVSVSANDPEHPASSDATKRFSTRVNAGVNAQKDKQRREAEMRREAIQVRNKRNLRSKRKQEELERGTRRTRARLDLDNDQDNDNNGKEEILYKDDLESDQDNQDNEEPEKEDAGDDDYVNKPETKARVESSSEEESEEEEEDLPRYPGQPTLVSGTELRDFQKNGVDWLSTLDSNGFSGILADEMGLGKTLQTITFLAKLIEDGSKGPFLIICPLSVVKNWIKEFAKFTPKLQPVMYHGDGKKRTQIRQEMKTRGFFNPRLKNKWAQQPRIVCTTYEMMIRDAYTFRRVEWRYIVVDEGHRLRNMDTKLMKQLKTLVSANRLIITGTPLQNNLKELWSLLNFCLPQLFDDLESFNTLFDFDRVGNDEDGNPIEKQDKTAQLVETLHEILRPFLLRRLKSDVAKGLPPKKEYVLYAPLTQKQQTVYNAILNRQIRAAISNLKTHGNINGDVKNADEDKPQEILAPRSSKYRTNHNEQQPIKIDEDRPDNDKKDQKDNQDKSKASNGNDQSITAFFSKKEKPDTDTNTKTNDKDKIVVIDDSDDEKEKEKEKDKPKSKGSALNKDKSVVKDGTVETNYNSTEDKMDDDDFEAMLLKEAEEQHMREAAAEGKRKSLESAREAARKEMGRMKFENLVMQARKICAHPYIFHWDVDADNEKTVGKELVNASGKMMLCMRLLEELKSRGHKTLIFSQFVTFLDIMEDYLVDGLGWNICRFDGSTGQEDRERQIEIFNNMDDEDPDKPMVFLLSTRAGGLGINLVGADSIIFYDSDWNPQVDIQATDRVHRIGQTKPVLIFRLVTQNSIEQKMMEAAKGKRKLESMVITQGHYKQDNSSNKVKTTGERLTKALNELDITNVRIASDGENLISDEELEQLLDRSETAMKREQGWTHDKGSNIAQVMGVGSDSNGEDNIKLDDLEEQSAMESSNVPSGVASAEPSRAVSESTDSKK
ncbi:hypothetical protein E3P99_01358 [Wallemia hederae]|uniref:Helicase ATP-binding domain-containing protein n=1 Tax=Wallemia hederae TaxID=1540922 RepID=A0A4T0FV00_9BASI|nr:hypothetical protein E3P99_01358 [Wallemia hederae]